jgi:hypothetical protein
MDKKILKIFLVLAAMGIFNITGPVSADTSKLIGSLVDSLGVSQEQATGGAGAVFKEAKNNMGPDSFSAPCPALIRLFPPLPRQADWPVKRLLY